MRSKAIILAILLFGFNAIAGQPGEKRVILTSGEKVHTIRYQLGQSTVIFLGLKPETVICGNKNYFNIEKIKEGITVQPLTNFSTNLTILNGDRRYLFYLTPAQGEKPDGFVDVKWVPQSEALPVEKLKTSSVSRVIEIGQKVRIDRNIELSILRQKVVQDNKRQIFELELKNISSEDFKTLKIDVLIFQNKKAVPSQMTIWEDFQVKSHQVLKGRIILSDPKFKDVELVVRFQGKDIRTLIKGIIH